MIIKHEWHAEYLLYVTIVVVIVIHDDTTTLLRALVGIFCVECIIVAGRTVVLLHVVLAIFTRPPKNNRVYPEWVLFLGMTRVQHMYAEYYTTAPLLRGVIMGKPHH